MIVRGGVRDTTISIGKRSSFVEMMTMTGDQLRPKTMIERKLSSGGMSGRTTECLAYQPAGMMIMV
jgi:hypothetical protein